MVAGLPFDTDTASAGHEENSDDDYVRDSLPD